jgi:hypothetical protein
MRISAMKNRITVFLLAILAACAGLAQPSFAETPTAPAVTTAAFTGRTVDSIATVRTMTALSRRTIAVRAPATASLRTIAPSHSAAALPATAFERNVGGTRLLLSLAMLGFAGSIKTVAADKDTFPVRDTIRQQLNKLIQDFWYLQLNNLAATTIATLPVCAIATVTSKVKTTAATVLLNAGALKALAATDNFWTLTGGVLAVNSFRRYLLLCDAVGTATVMASTDAATAAACAFPTWPPGGTAIVGIVTVATDATHPFTPATTLLGAAGITATFIDGNDDSVIMAAQVTP